MEVAIWIVAESPRHSPTPITSRKSASRLQAVAFHLCVNDEAHALGKCDVNSSHLEDFAALSPSNFSGVGDDEHEIRTLDLRL